MKTARYAICRLDFSPFLLLLFAPKISGLSAKMCMKQDFFLQFQHFFFLLKSCTTNYLIFCHLLLTNPGLPNIHKVHLWNNFVLEEFKNSILVFQSQKATQDCAIFSLIFVDFIPFFVFRFGQRSYKNT